jgi:hypothetical protein
MQGVDGILEKPSTFVGFIIIQLIHPTDRLNSGCVIT